jgi:hypothetical protein
MQTPYTLILVMSTSYPKGKTIPALNRGVIRQKSRVAQ